MKRRLIAALLTLSAVAACGDSAAGTAPDGKPAQQVVGRWLHWVNSWGA